MHTYVLSLVSGLEHTIQSEYDSINSMLGMLDATTYSGNMFVEVVDAETGHSVFINMARIITVEKIS